MKPSVARRVFAVVGAALALAAVAGVAGITAAPALAAASSVTPAAVAAISPPYPAGLVLKSELHLKADLIVRSLVRSPQLVFFGGARSTSR
jgi:hypothetical protein